MQIIETPIEGLLIVQLKIFRDHRGYFVERFRQDKFVELGLNGPFVQDNHSYSEPGVLRGLHMQHSPPQAKLIGVSRGRIWDVAVDLRKNSPTFGHHHGLELSADNALLFFIPAGFAHGFCVLGHEPADAHYKVDNYYNPKGEVGLRWNDPELNVPWPIENPIVSDRDQAGISLQEFVTQ